MLRNEPRNRAATLVLAALTGGATLAPGAMQFTEVAWDANIRHTYAYAQYPEIHGFTDDIHSWISAGAVAEDFDGDGWIDLYVLQGGSGPNLLYINQGNGTFLEEAAARGAGLTGSHFGTCAADFDRDGDVDIFISSATSLITSATTPHTLLINDGSGHFTVSAQVFGTSTLFPSSPSWGDIDNDGLLDLVLGAWAEQPQGGIHIYRNIGNGQFQLQQSLPKAWTFVPRFADINGDRFQDLLVSADFGQASYYRNDGRGLMHPAGFSDVENGMGNAVGDIDNDGDLDWFITSIRDFDEAEGTWGLTGNRLHLNDGSGDFSDITGSAGVRDGYWGWGAEFADFDNDGDLDIYHVNGWPDGTPNIAAQFSDTPACLFENLGGNTFQEIAAASGDAGNTGQGRCVVVFDYDNDGDQDIFIANNHELVVEGAGGQIERPPGQPILLRNDTPPAGAWLKVQLEGLAAPHHSHGIGARVYVSSGGVTQMRELNASSGFNGHGPGRIAHFGLGGASQADVVRAVWTNGDESEIRAVAAEQAITVTSPRATVSERVVDPGGSVTVTLAGSDLPPGATATWSSGGMTFANPAIIPMSTPGEHLLVLTIMDSESGFLRSERLRVLVVDPSAEEPSVARRWNEEILTAIRIDKPDPTVHSRNLFHLSAAMWDAWAAYDPQAVGYLHNEAASPGDVNAARNEAISHAAYRVLNAGYAGTINASTSLASFTLLMAELGYDPSITTTAGNSPAAVGNRVAEAVLNFFASDGAADEGGYLGGLYQSANGPLLIAQSGTVMAAPNRWQPLLIENPITQNGQTGTVLQSFLGSHWGAVRPFALDSFGPGQFLHLDPGPPPELGGATDADFKDGNLVVLTFSSLLDPAGGNYIDISPSAIGNNTLGLNDGSGHVLNPVTAQPYPPNIVNHADFGRVLAEFWADGPDSETPPGHWNVLLNKVGETEGFERRFAGQGDVIDALEWDVKAYFALNGALHDAAVAAWGLKRAYDFVRPVSSIRHMGGLGQSSDPGGSSYDPLGLPLVANLTEVVTSVSSAPGERHAHLSGHVGEVAVRAWSEGSGVGWILAADWLPYQRDSFVTPAFPGYVSGHSTFSRAAAEVLTRLTGDPYFPGGMATFTAHKDDYLEFETGPTADVVLQWATYYDAADQAGISRLYGGIHVPVDDGPGRVIGAQCGISAWDLAVRYFDGSVRNLPFASNLAPDAGGDLVLEWDTLRGAYYQVQQSDSLSDDFPERGEWIQAVETRGWFPVPDPHIGGPRRFFRVVRAH